MAGHPLPARSATWRQGDCFFQIGLLSGNGSKSKICSLGKGKSIEIWWFGVSIFRLEGRFLDLFLKIAAHMRVQCGTNNPVNPGSGGWRRFGSSNLTDEENPFDAPKPLASENGIVRLYIVTFVRKLGCYNYCCCIYIYISSLNMLVDKSSSPTYANYHEICSQLRFGRAGKNDSGFLVPETTVAVWYTDINYPPRE